MNRIARFEHVSAEQFEADWRKAFEGGTVPPVPPLPRRATTGSAGYDFFSPMDFTLSPGEILLIPTGIRAQIDEGWVLMLFPRSGLGFKYRLQLNNTVGVIDSDYYNAKNEGHIHLKLINDSRDGRTLVVRAGDAVAQGIFLPFGVTTDDQAGGAREGGFGSTDKGRE